MSERSSPRSLALAVALVACGKGEKVPEVDPAQARDLAAKIAGHMPGPSTVRVCAEADFVNVFPITDRSIHIVAGLPVPEFADFKSDPTLAAWINPPTVEAPAVAALIDDKASAVAKRRAAAQLVGAKAVIMYRADVVNAPLALQVKHLARGTVHARLIRFEDALPVCVSQLEFQNDKEKSDWAIAMTDKAIVDPEVAKAMRDDLADQLLKRAPTANKK